MTFGPRVLYIGGFVYSAHDPFATAVLIADGIVAWVGSDSSAQTLFAPEPDVSVRDLHGSLVTPSFVDSCPAGTAPTPATGVTATVPDGPGLSPLRDPDTDFFSRARSGLFALGSGGVASSPWAWVHGAALAPPAPQRVSARAAFMASTRAGRRLLDSPHSGALNPGEAASLVVWEPWDLVVHGDDARVSKFSTDARAGTPLLPDLSRGEFPRAKVTMVKGRIVWAADSEAGA